MKIKLLILFSILSCTCISQENTVDTIPKKRLVKFPLFSSDYFYYPNSDFNTNSGERKIKINELRTSFQFVFPIKDKKTYLLIGIQHSLFNYITKTKESQGLNLNETYHSFQYKVGLIQVLPKKWRLVLSFSPTVASDFNESLNSDDLILQTSLLASKRSSRNFEYGFGMAYTSRFGRPTVLPLIKLTYNKNNWLTVVVLPSYVSQFYTFGDNARIGIKAAIYGSLYNVDFDSNISSLDLNRVFYSRITIGPEYQVKLMGSLYLNMGAGIALRNVLEVQDNDLNTELDLNLKNRSFFNIGLRILK